ncbi:hypothetical protein FACS1894113_0490 [Alphaproteobacteria bacterium]|nr:hypothetical protein FACS1894113_0490 [Alphaproteobacteria bacterium]
MCVTTRSFLVYGKNKAQNLGKSYELAINYMITNSALDSVEVEKYARNNVYPNFLFLKKAEEDNELSVDAARTINEFLSRKAEINGNSAVIIDSAELMSSNAANSLLKTLEEPPENFIIILSTSRLSSILPTIRSRCVKIKVETENISTNSFDDCASYVKKVFSAAGKIESDAFIEKSVNFIKTGMSSISEFVKALEAGELELFKEVCFLYVHFHLYKNPDYNLADMALKLQDLLEISNETYPDKQSLVTAIWCIFKENLL